MLVLVNKRKHQNSGANGDLYGIERTAVEALNFSGFFDQLTVIYPETLLHLSISLCIFPTWKSNLI